MPGKKNTNLDTIGLEMGNTPPQALDVEEAVLGAMLLEASAVDQAMEELTPSCFYDQRHRMIFEAISHLVTEHISVDILTATNRLKQEGNLEAVGGAITLANLSQKVGSAAHIEYHIKILKQKSIQRELITASYDILHQAYDESVKVDDLVDNAQTKIFDAIQNNLKKEVQGIGDLINVAMSDIQKMQNSIGLSGVPSGFVSLDAITMGWQKSDLIILAARPAIGKTAFALNMARNAAVDHHMPVAVFSLEMSAVQLTKRLMTSESGLPASKIKGGSKLEPYEWEQLEYKLKNLSAAPLYIDDTPSIPVMEFRTKVKNLVKSKQVRLVIVDYLQLMQGPSELRGMREQEVAAISRTLKQTAKELEVPIIALSQLSRQSVQRSGGSGRPQLSDLRESGSIEQDADMVIFIHRPDALGLSENPSSMEETQIIIAKHRNGSVGELPMIFKSEQIRFMEPNETLDVRAATTVASGINASASDDFSNPNF
ncbi:MAG: replicative DNA helicase [Bacteroidales bacterium]|nr:replicative DNA helicase [Bacteroidales bacterium]MBQ4169592.1 replicative DNA helicase [Bacteroidales bacterium]